ncbi:polyphosphate kinase 1 [Cupriavidus taiwanensis]|uniref:Polyphosphate kinase n=1 Tax=Cupriavidus taiwanensis (strain DSM 17343 / BCRC 17206 / CCUG 44338 / CIP 107171 / LMG 19424 / R1) TaxID=977880 RepID=B3R1R1_CUPTR|nr:polyphosphate kinase 1 [Cupriavidus taiwanensis]CAQ69909.1 POLYPHOSPHATE KINASE PROTEIN [Cupriavidus taiwanensis LMG 19424]
MKKSPHYQKKVMTMSTTPSSTLLNRELGILEFNARVLAQAADPKVPLLERLKFICIVSSNLDEFFEIRMAGLKEQMRDNASGLTPDGLSFQQTYQLVTERTQRLVASQYDMLQNTIFPLLEKEGVFFHLTTTWTDAQREWAREFFQRELAPVLTPIALDPAHPFPRVLNKSLNFVVELSGKDAFGRDADLAIVQAPRALPRVVKMPEKLSGYPYGFVMLSSFMQGFVHELFPAITVHGCYQFRVTRNSDLFVSEDDITDLREALQGELPARHFGDTVRLEISSDTPAPLARRLLLESGLAEQDLYRVSGPVNLVRLMQIPDMVDRPALKFPPYVPAPVKAFAGGASMFDVMRQQDVLLHHPYESFSSVLDLLQLAAADPNVVAIKQTVYRTGNESLVMEALMTAARNGKEVTVVVELLARFDEETNINWAERLESAGAHVIYGVVGHKCHAKMLLIVRREPAGPKAKQVKLRRYAHLGTGNYHPRTARLYTDFGLLTADEAICEDVHHVFQLLTGTAGTIRLNHLWQSPFTMQSNLVDHIRAEARNARAGKPARIIAKMNALLEPSIIDELYKASRAGVKIDLIVRGVCALMPGVPGMSENITVRSIIGRFLEHHRVYYFQAAGAEVLYLSSADWMDRNLFRRVEVAFPVLDKALKARVIKESLQVHLRDNASAWIMQSDGNYVRSQTRSKHPHISQNDLLVMFGGTP